ncbi:hypothetical protein Nepgr_030480 [Nepenthes gracilis]|uniref:Uncharacterized protein n=1 Tax=Nepenthes gracilis TaxID=150966 RepID=A0AAD3TH23_NEPGR|nr:hypothetical protein Nepgr_030480 [Nepenthes gracilis]
MEASTTVEDTELAGVSTLLQLLETNLLQREATMHQLNVEVTCLTQTCVDPGVLEEIQVRVIAATAEA